MNKKFKRGALAAALVGVIATGGTLAYFSNQTGEKTNTFTMGSGVSAELKEPTWDHIVFDKENKPTGPKGEDLATNFYPNLTIPKDPTLKNNSDSNVYVAMKLTYTKAGEVSTFAELDKFIDVNFAGTGWTLSADKTLAYYTPEVAKSTKTTPLFTNIHIDELALTADQIDKTQYDVNQYIGKNVADYKIDNFDISVKGYVVQADGFNDVETAIQAAFPTDFN